MSDTVKFMLNGCDICFVAEAPKDMTVQQLLDQATKIRPDWCACGVRHLDKEEAHWKPEIIFGYDSVAVANDSVSCSIKEWDGEENLY